MTQWGLDTLFNPAKRHMDEEKQRLQATREEAGDSSGGKRIDLESGRVTIRRDDDEAEAAAAPESAGSPSAGSAATGAVEPASTVQLTDAQRRAAVRRGRRVQD